MNEERYSLKRKKAYYDIEDLDHLKRVLLKKKAAVFDNLGKFRYIDHRIRFEADVNLRSQIWTWGYHNMKIDKDKRTDILEVLLSGKNIVLDGFGEVYIGFNPGFSRWHDFHGTEFVPPKPFLRFQVDLNFIDDLHENLP